jgi:hypothetical protein
VSGDRDHAEALGEEVSAVLAPLGLRLAPPCQDVLRHPGAPGPSCRA